MADGKLVRKLFHEWDLIIEQDDSYCGRIELSVDKPSKKLPETLLSLAEYTEGGCKRVLIFLTPNQTRELVAKLTEGLDGTRREELRK